MQGYVFLEVVEGRQIFDLGFPSRVIPAFSATTLPTVNIYVIGYYKSFERPSGLMASVKTCVAERVG